MAKSKAKAGKGQAKPRLAKPKASGKSAKPRKQRSIALPTLTRKAKGASAPAPGGKPALAPPVPKSVQSAAASPSPATGAVGDPQYAAHHLDEACAVWKNLTDAEKVMMIRELVETRSDELRLAYPGLLSLGYGYRHERPLGKGGKKLQRREVRYGERCVAFLVRDKWIGKSAPAGAAAKRNLPKHLFTYYHSEGERKLCAVPTDVHGQKQHYRRVRLQNARVRARSATSQFFADGVVTCAVRESGGGPTYLLGCHHVFAISKFVSPVPPDVVLNDLDSGGVLGSNCQFFGYVDAEGFFLDAALIKLSNQVPHHQVVTEPTAMHSFPLFVRDLAEQFSIHTPDGDVSARFVNAWFAFDSLPYPWPVRHKWVVEMEFDAGVMTSESHSGSPVFDSGGTIFQGMHIAGDDERAFMLPAFEILRSAHLGLIGGNPLLTLV